MRFAAGSPEEVFSGIDWPLLMRQKSTLLTLLDRHEHKLSGEEAQHLYGIVHLLDAIQDCACSAGLATEDEIFGPIGET